MGIKTLNILVTNPNAGNGNPAPFAIFNQAEFNGDYGGLFQDVNISAVGTLDTPLPLVGVTNFIQKGSVQFRWDFGGGGNTAVVSCLQIPYRTILNTREEFYIHRITLNMDSYNASQFSQQMNFVRREIDGKITTLKVLTPNSFVDVATTRRDNTVEIPVDLFLTNRDTLIFYCVPNFSFTLTFHIETL